MRQRERELSALQGLRIFFANFSYYFQIMALFDLTHPWDVGHTNTLLSQGKIFIWIWGTSKSSHYSDAIMSTMPSPITTAPIVCSTVCSGIDQRKHQISASLAFVREIPSQRPVTWKMYPFDDVIMFPAIYTLVHHPVCCNTLDFAKMRTMTGCLIIYRVTPDRVVTVPDWKLT